jgi:hypothetical protein
MTIYTDIKRTKQMLIKRAKNGLYENFGQHEVRKLKDTYIDISDYSREMNAKRDALRRFDNWCMNYTGK